MYSLSHQFPKLLLLLLVFFAASCSKTYRHYAVKGEFRYYNRLDTRVTIELKQGLNQAFATYDIAAGDSLSLFTDGETLEEVSQPSDYVPGILSDTTTLRFYDSLCYVEYRDDKLLHDIEQYRNLRTGDRDFLFMFDIDTVLVRHAARCS